MSEKHNRTEGDINLSSARHDWYSVIQNADTQAYLKEDADHFLHQALSTPCLDVLASCEGIYLTDIQGKKYMDFHGNNVHQVGYRNPYIIDRIKAQLDTLPFSPRRYTNVPAIELAKKLGGAAAG
jgi:4-aminobutyrate aminotransferase